MVAGDRRAVVVIAGILGDDTGVRLARKRAHNVRERLIRPPRGTVVGGLTRPHSVARGVFVALDAVSALARVIPGGDNAIVVGDREIGLPLRTSSRVSV